VQPAAPPQNAKALKPAAPATPAAQQTEQPPAKAATQTTTPNPPQNTTTSPAAAVAKVRAAAPLPAAKFWLGIESCALCGVGALDYATFPCNHRVVCTACAEKALEERGWFECPGCCHAVTPRGVCQCGAAANQPCDPCGHAAYCVRCYYERFAVDPVDDFACPVCDEVVRE